MVMCVQAPYSTYMVCIRPMLELYLSNFRMSEKNLPDCQLKIHTLHQNMQEWAKVLPMRIQQRMSCELLANMASCLVSDTTVFEIVNSLMDIQHIIESEMYHKRVKMRNEYSTSILNLSVSGTRGEEFTLKKNEIHAQHLEDRRKFDISVIKELDDKVREQQTVLEQAGVPGFRPTKDPLEIQVQMCLLDFIIRSGKIIYKL